MVIEYIQEQQSDTAGTGTVKKPLQKSKGLI